MKVCTKCNIEKVLEDFYKDKRSDDGHEKSCISCRKEKNKENYLNNKEKIRKRHKKYYQENKDYFVEYGKEYAVENKEELSKKRREYKVKNKKKLNKKRRDFRNKNKEETRRKSKEYRDKNPEKIKNYHKDYYHKNKEKNIDKKRSYEKEYSRERYKNDDLYKLSRNIKSAIRSSIKRRGLEKKCKTLEILGCSFKEFKIYVESKFEFWMTWNNHGVNTGNYNETWQLDHIIPISSANTIEEILKLNHYLNFQPLCSKKNLEKSNKLI